jgi:hypothetical protein
MWVERKTSREWYKSLCMNSKCIEPLFRVTWSTLCSTIFLFAPRCVHIILKMYNRALCIPAVVMMHIYRIARVLFCIVCSKCSWNATGNIIVIKIWIEECRAEEVRGHFCRTAIITSVVVVLIWWEKGCPILITCAIKKLYHVRCQSINIRINKHFFTLQPT